MRLQFRKHLIKDHCVENLEAYIQLMQFEETLQSLGGFKVILSTTKPQLHTSKSSDVNAFTCI